LNTKNCKQDESDGDSEFTATIKLGGKLASDWTSDIKQYWKWKGGCRAYRNPILESNVGQTSVKNGGKAYGA
jgi:hypothetical protein